MAAKAARRYRGRRRVDPQRDTGSLRAAGFSTATFEDAESFLGSASRASAACVVADMRMPGMTGLELYQALVASGDGIPTVIITAHPEDVTQLARARSGNHVLPQQAVRPGRAGRVRARSAREASRSYT